MNRKRRRENVSEEMRRGSGGDKRDGRENEEQWRLKEKLEDDKVSGCVGFTCKIAVRAKLIF